MVPRPPASSVLSSRGPLLAEWSEPLVFETGLVFGGGWGVGGGIFLFGGLREKRRFMYIGGGLFFFFFFFLSLGLCTAPVGARVRLSIVL